MLRRENHKSYKRASIKAYLLLQGLTLVCTAKLKDPDSNEGRRNEWARMAYLNLERLEKPVHYIFTLNFCPILLDHPKNRTSLMDVPYLILILKQLSPIFNYLVLLCEWLQGQAWLTCYTFLFTYFFNLSIMQQRKDKIIGVWFNFSPSSFVH